MATAINVQDRVKYSADFLASIGMSRDPDMVKGRAIVTELTTLGGSITLARVAWENGRNLPERINVKNLRRI
jgi:hypothetical protein